jgi:DNA replication protein DnaC
METATIQELLAAGKPAYNPYVGEWELTEESKKQFARIPLTAMQHDAIVFGDAECPRCLGTAHLEYQERETHTGELRFASATCRCRPLAHKRKVLAQLLPPKYIRCNLATLEPSDLSRMAPKKQREMIDLFRDRPNDSVLLWGKPGTSKTTFSCAVLRHAVERDWKYFYTPLMGGLDYDKTRWIWRVSFDTLMAQYLRKQNDREEPEPDVTPERIRAATEKGRKFVLCLEEIDKAKLTEHRCNKLFDIIDTLYNCGGQLIVTTNLTYQGFVDMFTKTDSETINTAGDALIRRVKEMCEPYEF